MWENRFLLRQAPLTLAVLVSCLIFLGAAHEEGKLCTVTFNIVDERSDASIPCRIHAQNAEGEPQRARNLPFYRDHSSCDGTAIFSLPPGTYTYLIERGPEFSRAEARFEVSNQEALTICEKLARLVDMAAEGWWTGELHVHRRPDDIELLMRAEDLHVAPVITWWNARNAWADAPLPENPLTKFDGNRYYRLLAGEDERKGGAFMYFNLQRPVDITRAEPEYPSLMHFIKEAKKDPNVWIDIEKPFWWDVPVALALGLGDSIGIANNHMLHGGMLDNEAWGKPRNREEYPSPLGTGFWTQAIYYHALNSGIRIPPSAGSASGVLLNPVGYNRVYVHLDEPLTYERWWEGLRAGRVIVTNGPLLRPTVEGKLPGHVFTSPQGEALKLKLEAVLDCRDPIASIEIIKNGAVVYTVPYGEFKETGSLGELRFDRSGWFLIRTIASVESTFRFASSGPYYVEIGSEKHHISAESVQFFLDWVLERIEQIDLEDPQKLADVLQYHDKAKQFWINRLEKANAD